MSVGNWRDHIIVKCAVYRFMPWLITPYYKLFTLVFWQPTVWSYLGPVNGVIDNKAHWFHRHAVTCLNKVRRGDSWVMMDLFGLKVRDPYCHLGGDKYLWSKKHLFVVKNKSARNIT